MRGGLVVLFVALVVASSGCITVQPRDLGTNDVDSTDATSIASTTNGTTSETEETPTDPVDLTPPEVALTTSQTTGKAPLNITFTLVFDAVIGTTSSWSIDTDGDGTVDVSGTVTENGTIERSALYDSAGTFGPRVTVVWADEGETLLDETITVKTLDVGQYIQHSGPLDYIGCDDTAETWSDDDDVDDVGDHEMNGTIEAKVNPSTNGQTFNVTWSVSSGFAEAWIFFTRENGDIVKEHSTNTFDDPDMTITGNVPRSADWVVLHVCSTSAKTYGVTYMAAKAQESTT